MKISRAWLQNYFPTRSGEAVGTPTPSGVGVESVLPDAAALADALTFHAFEIEGVERLENDDILDVKVTPNRGHDCLSHRGIAKELSAILTLPMKADPLRATPKLEPRTDSVKVEIASPLCNRFTACHITGVAVGPSPEWLRQALESIGQRSINNIVDATNFVMFDLGQPLHAFDAGKLAAADGNYSLKVRMAEAGERMLALDDKEYAFTDSMMLVTDAHAGVPAGIAGIKGGKPSGVDEHTKDIILEAANFDGVSVRKTASALKLRTDASTRFEQVISPEYAAYGMRAAADLIVSIAGGTIEGFVDEYPRPLPKADVTVALEKINKSLGVTLSTGDVIDVFRRLDLSHVQQGSTFTIHPPFERVDLVIAEDIVEEVGRIVGYDHVAAVELSVSPQKPVVDPLFFATEKIREELIAKGYSEVYTSVFRDTGFRAVANKVDSARPFLRNNLQPSLVEAWIKNSFNRDLLGLSEVKLFEIGTVWKENSEVIVVGTVEGKTSNVDREQVVEPIEAETYDDLPTSTTERYKPFSRYPFMVRDIALWVPMGTEPETVLDVIRGESGELLQHSDLFDKFEKNERISYAFRLVFQSFEKTLTDADANAVMEKVNAAVKEKGWEVR